ncbi:MAG: peroxidase-related enzyme [Pseudomonadota bacterium]
MTRINQVTDDQASSKARALFDGIRQKVGMVPNLYRVMANEPAVLQANLAMNDALAGGSFDPATREAIALTTAGANHCDYCASAHTAISKSLKVDADEIDNRLRGRSDDPRLQAILAFAETIIEKRGFAGSDEISQARAAGLTDGEIMETVGNVVANIFTNYVNHVAETDIDFPIVRTETRQAA